MGFVSIQGHILWERARIRVCALQMSETARNTHTHTYVINLLEHKKEHTTSFPLTHHSLRLSIKPRRDALALLPILISLSAAILSISLFN